MEWLPSYHLRVIMEAFVYLHQMTLMKIMLLCFYLVKNVLIKCCF